jgi:hypothetical protein
MSVREAQRSTTTTAALHACASVYPLKQRSTILRDLAAHTPGEEGKWLAAAVEGYGFEVTGRDALDVASNVMRVAEMNGSSEQTRKRIRQLVARDAPDGIVRRIVATPERVS